MRLVLAFALCLLTVPARAAETALQVQSWCKEIANLRVDEKHQFTMNQTFDNGFCWGAFALFQEVSYWGRDGTKILGLCLPDGVGRIQLIKIFVHYVDDHPEQGHLGFPEVADMALRQSFSCGEMSPRSN
jgi:hypothetical protein